MGIKSIWPNSQCTIINSKPFRYQLSTLVNVNHIDFSYNPINVCNHNGTNIGWGEERVYSTQKPDASLIGRDRFFETNCSKIVIWFLNLMHIFIMSMKLK